MAIYHFSVKNISRSDGRSAVACAAYRSGEKLKDERYGKEQDYTRKTGVEFKNIYAPEQTSEELFDRYMLWNTVEQIEKRKNSQLAREFEIAFPQELNQQQRQDMLNELCQDIVKRHGVIVDAVIHAPHIRSGTDERNYHAHIMLTTRSINEQGELDKKTREFNDNGKQEVEFWRERFADLANHHLEKNGFAERIDHRSNADRGIDLEATWHEGVAVTAMKRRYAREQLKPITARNPEIIMPSIALENNAIKARNAEKIKNEQIIKGLDQQIIIEQRLLSQFESEAKQFDEEIAQQQALEAQKQRILAQEAKKQAEQRKIEKELLERKIEPSTVSKTPQEIIQTFNTCVQTHAKRIFSAEVQQQRKRLVDWYAKIEGIKDREPLFLGKKEWKAELAHEVTTYNAVRDQFEAFRKAGATEQHRKQAIQEICRDTPHIYNNMLKAHDELKNQRLEQAKKTIDPEITRIAEVDSGRYYGKVIQCDQRGTLQDCKDELVFHPHWKDAKVGEIYSIEYKGKSFSYRPEYDYSAYLKNRDPDKNQDRSC